MKYTTFIGLDIHKETIAVAIVHREGGQAEFMGTIPNNPDAIVKLVKKLGIPETLRFCYEAGPCGYGIYRQLNKLGASCIKYNMYLRQHSYNLMLPQGRVG